MPGPFSTSLLKKPRVQFRSPLLGPEAMNDRRRVEARHPRREAAELHRVLLGGEIAAAAPALVADAPVADLQRILLAVLGAQIGQRRRAGGRVAVLDPLVEVARRQAAQVGGEVGLAADHAAEARELDRAEMVRVVLRRAVGRLAHAVGPEVGAARPRVARADAVAPVVAVGEAAARPADRGPSGACASHRRAPGGCRRCSGSSSPRRPRCRRRRRRRGARRSVRRSRA